jgi:formylglycine-generating enzyme required for sulfatase activity
MGKGWPDSSLRCGLVVLVAWVWAAATEASPPSAVTNSIGLKLVLVPAGEFRMGGVEPAEAVVQRFPGYDMQPQDFRDEYPRHRVRITKSFYMGQTEVTVGQFRRFCQEAGYRTQAETDGQGGWGYDPAVGRCQGRQPQFNWANPGFVQTEQHPVINVTWDDARAFCQWLTKQEGHGYRLPTEAEWEYACRAGTTTRYPSGTEPDCLAAVAHGFDAAGKEFAHVQDLMIPQPGKNTFTTAVAQLKPNAFGLYDMLGNAWEWCADWHSEAYYAQSPLDNPTGPPDGDVRVRRGGAWNSFPLYLRASFRNWNAPLSRCVNLGFRVVRNAD